MPGDRSLIAHLFRRAGFGARPAELDYYATKGFVVAVEDLLSGRLMGRSGFVDQALDLDNGVIGNLADRVEVPSLRQIQIKWVQRMVATTAPLIERMTLFLHNHWATAYRPDQDIGTRELESQNRLFRTHALGDWRTLCHSMIEDVALSNWLSNSVNVKRHPNENLAREFMELFTLGPGNYTEADVREAARALTGYVTTYNLNPTGPRRQMTFDAERHDTGVKTILGQTGRLMPHDFVNIVLGQPAASRFLARKLAQAFVMPDPSDGYVNGIAASLTANSWDLSAALRFIFLSPEFAAPVARAAMVKSPAEFMIGVLRSLNFSSKDDFSVAVGWIDQAGQVLYNPPNVGGWPTNMGWLGAGGILARYNAGVTFADRRVNSKGLRGQTPLGSASPQSWGEIFGISDLSEATVDAMNGYLRGSMTAPNQAVEAGIITLLLASPDYLLS